MDRGGSGIYIILYSGCDSERIVPGGLMGMSALPADGMVSNHKNGMF